MLNVPVRVKEALRDGGYRKNYRIDVLKGAGKWVHYGDVIKGTHYTSSGKLVVRDNGRYMLKCSKLPSAHIERQGVYRGYFFSLDESNPLAVVSATKGDAIVVGFWFDVNGTTWHDGDEFVDDDNITSVEVLRLDEGEETDFVITNDNLVSESVTLDERMNSGDTFKFGLCEGSALEFEYFGFENIKDRKIRVALDVEYPDENGVIQTYTIPMGFYTVDACQRQASTGIFKVTAYNRSKFLDSKANSFLSELARDNYYNVATDKKLDTLMCLALADYEAKAERLVDLIITADIGYHPSYSYTAHRWTIYDDNGNPTNEVIDYISGNASVRGTNTYYTDSFYRFEINLDEYHDFIVNNCPYLDYKIAADGTTVRDCFENLFGIEWHEYDVGARDVVVYYGEPRNEQDNFRAKGIYNSGYTQQLINEGGGFVGTLNNNTSGYDVPIWFYKHAKTTSAYTPTAAERNEATAKLKQIFENCSLKLYRAETTTIGQAIQATHDDVATWADVTLRQLKSALLETECLIGNVGRDDGLFKGIMVNRGHLLPSDALYPSNSLLPITDAEHPTPSAYQTLYMDDGDLQNIKYLIITYKGLDGEGNAKDYTLQRTVNTNGTTNYNMSDNWLFRNFVWTAEDVGMYADRMVERMRNIKWMPFELCGAGLPYIEVGDEIEVSTGEKSYTSYVFQRQLKGIQNLEDTYVNGTLNIY